jgi:hypothetical protein
MQTKVNRPLYDTGWRVGMPAHINPTDNIIRLTPITITCMDGRNREVTLVGYGRPEWTTVDR